MRIKFHITTVVDDCYRVSYEEKWGLVTLIGKEWRAEIACVPKSREPSNVAYTRRPRYRRLGLYPTREEAMASLKASLNPPVCEFKPKQFCTGKDVRAIIRRYTDLSTGRRNVYSGVVSHWCAGCRKLNQGGFKYAR
jgi:hypothetical protein